MPSILAVRCIFPAAVGALALAGALPAGAARAADVLELQGRGAQIYVCAAAEGGFAWRLRAPDAILLDASGRQAGRHFAGPSWQAEDGSTVVGEAVASGSFGTGSVPWLVLRARSRSGEGVFGRVTYVVRSRTVGGVAPAGGCDAGHAGAETRVAYSATYTFFSE